MCDHCVVLLLDDLERAGALLPAIREQLRGVNASSVVWARLHRLNASIADLQVLPCLARPGPPSLPFPGRRLSPSPPRRASSGNPLAPATRLHSSWRHWNDRPQASGRTCSSWTARQALGEPTPWNAPPPGKPFPGTASPQQTPPQEASLPGPQTIQRHP